MTPTDEELDEELGLAFNEIFKRIGTRSFNQQKRAYEAWLAKYVPILEARGRSWHALEARRGVLTVLLDEAWATKRPLITFERLLGQIEALGWSSLYRKAHEIPAMCSYFADRMWNKAGLRYLLPLQKELEAEYARTQEQWMANALITVGTVEARLRARSRPF